MFEKLRNAYINTKGALAYIETINKEGDKSIGSSFHLGDGVFVTAAHVVKDLKISEIATTEVSYMEDSSKGYGEYGVPNEYITIEPQKLNILKGPYYHKDDDVAVVQCDKDDMDFIPMGYFASKEISDYNFILKEAIVLGYPPIPTANNVFLTAAKAEVNAIIETTFGSHPEFILGTIARGGYSGGPVIMENGSLLGLLVKSLVADKKATELGYLSALSVEPVLEVLNENNLIPKSIQSKK